MADIMQFLKKIELFNNFPILIANFLNYSPLPELMQGAGVAVLTLLISFAIGIFIHHLGDGERKGNFLDLHIALDFVWRFKPSLIILLILVLSPFFMGIKNLHIKTIIFVVWALALGTLFWILLRLYAWVKGDKNDFRRRYLSDFSKPPRDKIAAWGDFWSTETNLGNSSIEKDFFVSFSKEIDALLQSDRYEDWETLQKLLDGFVSKIENRDKIFILIFSEFFPKILEWHYILWVKQYSKFAKSKSSRNDRLDHHTFEVQQLVNEIIEFVTKEALIGSSRHAFSYFKTLEIHIEKYKNESVTGERGSYLYLEQLPIYSDCLNLIPHSKESDDIWAHYFPESWKVTIQNIESNDISRIWYKRFQSWSQSRIQKESKDWDNELEELIKELFPSVDPITWSKIYSFVLSPWTDFRVKRIIEKDVNFGYIGRIYTGWGDDAENNFAKRHEEELDATFELAICLFPNFFTKENIDKWLVELGELQYPEDSDQYQRMRAWESIFNSLRKRVI